MTNPGDPSPDRCPICGPLSGCRCPNTLRNLAAAFQAAFKTIGEAVQRAGTTTQDDYQLTAGSAR